MRLFTLRPPPIAFVQFSTFLSSPSFAIVSRSLSLSSISETKDARRRGTRGYESEAKSR
ncbi:MAG: hypothetical protein ACTS5F_00645 [Candidatus Hodgkinia cicadicola]